MPHLQFDINKKLNSKDKNKFCKYIRNNFGKIMKTGTDHVAISLRELGKDSLSLGRAKDNEYVCFMNLDVRVGRSVKQKRELVKSYIKGVNQFFGIKKENQYITFTLHNGRDFNLYEKSLENWLKGDDPLNKK
ncbi:MAG: hypothetical protein CFH25_00263 [Alphaproteobacteria bacterium MarineAlpha6_Bin3]|nr:MAG: hypothetical protein CFH25_00263 [Alphaproteobacteria bacterium MarineAlpha6_Bin3]